MNRHFFGHIVFMLAIIAGFSAIVLLIWNLIIPGIFGLPVINFWQAAGLFILARILFGRFWGREGMPFEMRRPMRRGFGNNPIREKWMKMTPEEREEFINKKREHFRSHHFGR